MGVTPSAVAAEFERCMQEERSAWKRVGGHMPGSPGHDKAAWLTWVECVRKSDFARERVKAEILWPVDQSAAAVHDGTPPASEIQSDDEEPDETVFVPSRPVPLSEAPDTNLRFKSMLQEAGFKWWHFRTNLLRLDPVAFPGANFIVTITCARLGVSRTYEAEDDGGWLADFEHDLRDGIFSALESVPS